MLKILQLAVILSMITACKSLSHDEEAEVQALVANEVTLWPDPAHISVCWEPLEGAGNSFAEEKVWVKDAISNTWSQADPRIRFVGWDTCPATSSGLRIKIDNKVGGHTSGFGAALAGMPSGMQLTLDLPSLIKNGPAANNVRAMCQISRDVTKSCVQSIAIHEFGHALGLMHEQNRSDVAAGCDKYAPYQAISGTAIGVYDPDSIMNYCANLQNPTQTNLSVGDKQGIVALYSGDKVGTQDPGRPAVTFAQDPVGEVTNIVWGHDVIISVAYNISPASTTASLPDPATQLKIVENDADVAIPCGPWVITPVLSNLEIRSSQCTLAFTVNRPGNLGDLRWNDKFVASVNVDAATSSFQGVTSDSKGGVFDINYAILVAPGMDAPQVTIDVTTYPGAEAVAITPVNCGNYGNDGNYICGATSVKPLSSGTMLKLDGQMVVGGKEIKLASAFGVVP